MSTIAANLSVLAKYDDNGKLIFWQRLDMWGSLDDSSLFVFEGGLRGKVPEIRIHMSLSKAIRLVMLTT